MHNEDHRSVCIHQLFEQQVSRTPDATALIFENEQLSYRQLNDRANQLAHYLRGIGVGQEVLVGICAERSLDLLVGLMGILKAGGAFVPFDPAYPPERLAFMLEDSRVPVLVTQSHILGMHRDLLRPSRSQPGRHAPAPEIVCLDSDWPTIAEMPSAAPSAPASAKQLAYMIYTSGSTGRPKGALIEHAGVCNQLRWRQDAYPLGANDRSLHAASLSFDIAVWELFGPLIAGAAIVMAAPGQQRNTADLAELIVRQHISILQLPTPLLRVLIEEPALAGYDRLRHIFCGGEALTLETQRRCFELLPSSALHNLYGPTEATIEATYWDCQPGDTREPIPIGWPLPNKQLYILDEQLAPVPAGTPGELCIGGIGLARGYLNRPQLTAEKFVQNPFAQSDPSGAYDDRIYRSGDLARTRDDGAIEFLGRIDNQVKLRGFRIELGEIEMALLRHPLIQQAVVLAREDVPGHKRLVAYAVPNEPCDKLGARYDAGEQPCYTPNPALQSELRTFLQDQLPEYMVPATFVLLAALPLTPNAKIDRAALPPPRSAQAAPDEDPGETGAAARLAQIWADVLGLPRVGPHDNFFELGGDSILSIQLIARAQRAGLRISPKQLFEHPTVAELAAVAGVAPDVLAEQGAVTGPVPLTPIQRWFFEQNFPNPHHWNQAMLLEVPADIDPALLEQALTQLLTQHDALRHSFSRSEAGWQQHGTPPGATLHLAQIHLEGNSQVAQRTAIEVASEQLQSSLDLAHAPRMRALLFHLGDRQPGRLLIVINYLAIDGVSWRILLDDLQSIYQQLRRGQALALPPKTTAYQQWAQRLHSYARSDALREQLAYWLDAIGTAAAIVPLDMPGGSNTIASAQSVTISLSAEETRALLQEVPKTYHTQINDVLLAALMRAWHSWAGMRSLLITLESHGREDLFDDVDLSRTVGWFTSFFPVLLQTPPSDELRAQLIATKEQLRRIPHHGIGYGLLRYLANDPAISAQLAALPRPLLRFNYLGQFDQVLSGDSLFRRAREPYGRTRSPAGQRTHALVAEGLISEGQLHFTWTYSANLHHQSTIDRLASRYLAELRSLIAHCLAPEAGAFTPSDFQLAGLNQQQLDDVAALISQLDDEE